MLPDRVSNPGPLTYESGALPIALRGQAVSTETVSAGGSAQSLDHGRRNAIPSTSKTSTPKTSTPVWSIVPKV